MFRPCFRPAAPFYRNKIAAPSVDQFDVAQNVFKGSDAEALALIETAESAAVPRAVSVYSEKEAVRLARRSDRSGFVAAVVLSNPFVHKGDHKLSIEAGGLKGRLPPPSGRFLPKKRKFYQELLRPAGVRSLYE